MISSFDDLVQTLIASLGLAENPHKARAVPTGALSGAMVGLAGIPERFVASLTDSGELLDEAPKVVELKAG
ncbi:MAG: hypothetical protein GY866_20180 [Proteobacteria bacterium]|nr:hypothetical protein [Pseudomonadota bacterium]